MKIQRTHCRLEQVNWCPKGSVVELNGELYMVTFYGTDYLLVNMENGEADSVSLDTNVYIVNGYFQEEG